MKCIGEKCRYYQEDDFKASCFRCGVDARLFEKEHFKERECDIINAIAITDLTLTRLKTQKDKIIKSQK